MASGDPLFILYPNGPNRAGPATNNATHDDIIEGGIDPIIVPVLDYDGAADEHAHWLPTMPPWYAGGGFTWSYKGGVDGTDVDIIELELRMQKWVQGDIWTADLNIDTQTASALQDTPIATSTNKIMYSPITGALSHTDAGSPDANDIVIIRITRDVSVATNTDDFQLAEVTIKEA